jgi:anti-anti-sigma factor
MEIQTERKDDALIFHLTGRLDGQGSAQLDTITRHNLGDDDKSVVVDMAGVPYLSSAGIRILLFLTKELKRRKGILTIAGAGAYPLKVLDTAGFLSIFNLYPTVDEAVQACRKAAGRPLFIEDLSHPSLIVNGVRISFDRGALGPACLRVTGDIRDIMNSSLTERNVQPRKFSEIPYSLGVGAVAENVREAMPALGEMITVHGAMIWQPADGSGVPDFIVPQKDTGEIHAFTGFTVALDGPFHDIVTIESDHQEGISISDLYHVIFENARKKRKDFRGIAMVALWGITAGIAGVSTPHPPVLPDGSSGRVPLSVASSETAGADADLMYSGNTLLVFGYGVDSMADLAHYDRAGLDRICPLSPEQEKTASQYLHNHGIVFKNIPWDPMIDINKQMRYLAFEEEFVDMRHLDDTTRIRRAKAGVAYIGEIKKDS